MWSGDIREDCPPRRSPVLRATAHIGLTLPSGVSGPQSLLCDGTEQASAQPDGTTSCIFLVFSLSPSVAVPSFLLAALMHSLPFHPFKQVIV